MSCALLLLLGASGGVRAESTDIGFADPRHGYWTQPPRDRFSRLRADLDSGARQLDSSSEKALLLSLLEALEVPVSSQMLVMSATSLQKGLINPRNPRALYFNDDTYVGYVPGGRLEIASVDPQLGSIFYILDRARGGRPPRTERSEGCLNCHAPHYLNEIPALVIESVVPGMTGGGEKAFRRQMSGHGVPLDLRFGGWQVTGADSFPRHWGNIVMEYTDTGRRERTVTFGELFDATRYPVGTSDILPQLLHEHQVGFENRAVAAIYDTRSSGPADRAAAEASVEQHARTLVRYLLFADEVPLPAGGVIGDSAFKAAFHQTRKAASTGASLKDFELGTHLFRYRCSYMIYSPAFAGLPDSVKQRVYGLLERTLSDEGAGVEFAYLPLTERQAIRSILRETLPDLPAGWGGGAATVAAADR